MLEGFSRSTCSSQVLDGRIEGAASLAPCVLPNGEEAAAVVLSCI